MLKVIKYTLWALGIAGLSACTMDEMDSAFDKVPVEFSVVDSAAAQMTRATSSITTFTASETVKVYVKPNGASSYTGYDYTTAAAGNAPSLTAPSTPPYFPAGSSTTVQAYAYYPSTAGTTFSVSTNQTSDANYKASDLMYASNRTITKGSTTGTALAMSHKMAQLKLVVAAASGSGLSISSVKVNAKYQVSFTASSGAATVTGSATDITALTAAGTGYILIPPQAINGITVKVTASSQTATYTFTSTNSLEAGKSYTMNLTVGLNDVGVTTSISTWTGSGTVTVNPTVETGGLKAIDLGLSVKWANINVGATSETDYGMYFMWGDVAGHPGFTTDGFSFEWANYKWGTSSSNLTKYTSSDGKTTLEAADDAATANWGSWRMPTQAEFNELLNNTTNAWTSNYNDTGVAGYTFTANGQTLFLPAAGCRRSTYVDDRGSYGFYWSSTLSSGKPSNAYRLIFYSGSAYVSDLSRCSGYAVRPVYEPYTSMSRAMTSDVGKVICSNGHIHATVSAVYCGGTASGIIAYVGDAGSADKSSGSGSYKGLALALYNYGGSLTSDGTTCKWYTDNSGTCVCQSPGVSTAIGSSGDWGKGIDNTNRLATAACGSGHTHAAAQNAKNFSVARPSGASQWFLPTMYQWNLMVKAMCGKSTNLTTSTNNDYKADKFNEKITAAGGRGVLSGYYWSSVGYGTGYAWAVDFAGGYASDNGKSGSFRVRAVFAF